MNSVALAVALSSGVLLLSQGVVIALAVFFVAFALAMIWVALWYNARQDKQVRTDREAGDEDPHDEEGFVMRPGESEDEDTDGQEGVEPGTTRYRRA